MRGQMDPKHKALLKLFAFKGFVFLQFIQKVLFGLLNGKTFSATAHVTYDDIYYGIPNALTCFEAFLFSVLFLWAFRTNEYHPNRQHTQGHRMPFWRAIFNALNLSDLVIGIVTMFRLVAEGQFMPLQPGSQRAYRSDPAEYPLNNIQPQYGRPRKLSDRTSDSEGQLAYEELDGYNAETGYPPAPKHAHVRSQEHGQRPRG